MEALRVRPAGLSVTVRSRRDDVGPCGNDAGSVLPGAAARGASVPASGTVSAATVAKNGLSHVQSSSLQSSAVQGDAEADGEDQEPATIDVEDADDQRTDSPACAAGGSLDSGDDTSLSPINVEIEVHCLICSTLINLQLDQYCDIYLDNIVTAHSKLPVSEKLGRVLRYHFSPELLYSHTLCRRCFNIINGIDQLEGRLDKLRYGQDSDTDWAVADAGALF
ncbi:hypothetical protein FJT64_021711 [Amphibalanus amphitrite]|uniref:ZAD domain-containing protein n=1 Tax=Amphibalanus amphitrite TaxID=1232801 RepID=A0A6A4WJ21_AMPAM|nr:hypothetical protein FJT64_021711 [Amphibalanus amphitrite]